MRKRTTVRRGNVLRISRACDRLMADYQILTQLKLGKPDIAPPTVFGTLSALTDQGTFRADRYIVEIQGQCRNCAA